MYVAAAAAAAAATAAVTVSNDREMGSHPNALIVGSGSQTQPIHSGSLVTSDRPSPSHRRPSVPITDSVDQPSGDGSQTTFTSDPIVSNLGPSLPAHLSQSDVSSSSKAILLGDFLTAQQLERSELTSTSKIGDKYKYLSSP